METGTQEPAGTVEQPHIDNAYGWYVTLLGEERCSKLLAECDADNKTEVCVEIEGVERMFTFKDFRRRLGFPNLRAITPNSQT